jgi:hypothetical protein
MAGKRIMWLAGGLAALLVAVGLPLGIWAWQRSGGPPTVTDGGRIQESAEMGVTPGPAEVNPPAGGGTGEAASIQESIEYIIRDASGKVKQRKVSGSK